MGVSLTEIAQQLKDANKKVQLIYAFNGTGKTRLSREFTKKDDEGKTESSELALKKILYYSAFTEDLFYWENNEDCKLKIQPNSFTDWILRDRGQDQNIITNFQRYTDNKLNPNFIETDKTEYRNGKPVVTKTFPEVTFSFNRGSEITSNVKISKGEESNFIWSIFYTLLREVVSILDEFDPNKRDDNQFDKLEYVFIDDPVSSLDDSHLIELAVDLAVLIKSSKSDLRFIVTTHNPLFYNVLCNELNNKVYEKQSVGKDKLTYNPDKNFKKYRLDKKADGLFQIEVQSNDSPFSYHLFLLSQLQDAIMNDQIKKYHFNFLRNILEKVATFLGYKSWPALLPKTESGQPDPFLNRILNLSSHSAHAGEEIADVEDKDKEKLDELVKHLITTYGFKERKEKHG